MEETITGPLKVAQSMGFAGMGLLAAVLALWVVAQLVPVFKAQLGKRNGGNGGMNGTVSFEKLAERLRLQCPVVTGRRSIDDLYDVLIQLLNTMDGVRNGQEDAARDLKDWNDKLVSSLGSLTRELDKGGMTR